MGFGRTEGNHEYWYDPDKKEFVLTLFKTNEDGKDHSYLIKPDNIVQAATMLDEYNDEDFSLYDMLKFLKDNNVMDDYVSVAKELAERYSDQPPVWLDEGNIDSALGLVDQQNDESDAEEYTCDEFANGDKDLADYLRTILGTGKHTTEDFESALEGYNDNSDEGEEPDNKSTNLGGIAKALTANDLGRRL